MRTDKELLFSACNFLANYMETGDVLLSKSDLEEQHSKKKPRNLNEDQLAEVRRLRLIASGRI